MILCIYDEKVQYSRLKTSFVFRVRVIVFDFSWEAFERRGSGLDRSKIM